MGASRRKVLCSNDLVFVSLDLLKLKNSLYYKVDPGMRCQTKFVGIEMIFLEVIFDGKNG